MSHTVLGLLCATKPRICLSHAQVQMMSLQQPLEGLHPPQEALCLCALAEHRYAFFLVVRDRIRLEADSAFREVWAGLFQPAVSRVEHFWHLMAQGKTGLSSYGLGAWGHGSMLVLKGST